MEQKGTAINPNFVMDEAFNQIQTLQRELIIKSAYIRQLEDRLKVLESEKKVKKEVKKEETL